MIVKRVLCVSAHSFQLNSSILLWENPVTKGGLLPPVILPVFRSDTPLQSCVRQGWSLVGPKCRILRIPAITKASLSAQ